MPRHDAAAGVVVEVVRPLDRAQRADVERRVPSLPEQRILREELDGAIAGAMNTDLPVPDNPETVLEADLCARIDAEEIVEDVTEVVVQRTREPVSDSERAAESWQPQRRRQADQ